MELAQIIEELKSHANPEAAAGMARFGIQGQTVYGVSIPTLRGIAKKTGKNHDLAQQLWASGIHEARILASMVEIPRAVTEVQMEQWAQDFDSWDVVDQCCNNLFKKTPFAYAKARAWSERDEEFVKRAGFVLMATLAVADKKADDATFEQFYPLLIREAADPRNFVKKAINWALRQIGKRNLALNASAIATAETIATQDSAAARWIARDALRELTSDAVQERLQAKAAKNK